MSENTGNSNPSGSGAVPKRKRGNPAWRPYFRGGFRFNRNNNVPREKPTAFQINSSNNDALQSDSNTIPPNVILNQKSTTSIFLNTKCDEYPMWHLYFPHEKYDHNSAIIKKIKSFEKHFNTNNNIYNFDDIQLKYWFSLNLSFLLSDENFCKTWNNFYQDLNENPEMVLACAGISMHKLILENIKLTASITTTTTINSNIKQNTKSLLRIIRPRLNGYTPISNLKSLRGGQYEKLIAIRGTVIRAEPTEILSIWKAFKCNSCGTEQVVKQPDGIHTLPTSCKGQCHARSNFISLLSSPYTRTIQFQKIRIQEKISTSGQIPKIIEAELSEDLVDLVWPGDDITLTGILKVKRQEEIQRKDQASLHRMYIRAVAISKNKNTVTSRKSEFTENDMLAIKMISEEPYVFRLLIHSLCPGIYGHEMVKAGLLLGLFGASGSHTIEQNREGRRTEIHILVVGDPGVGKSQMLQSCAYVSPRGMFVCGNGSSSAGLTVSVRHDRGSGGGVIEAGALVLTDQGVCCLDELDKMSSNHQSLLEVMEDQTVSVAKAGVLCKIPARTSILAAANPKGGHYDRSKTVAENLKMNPALLSRFDLVFILLDRPNVRLDNLLTSHIQAIGLNDKKISSNYWNSSSLNKENRNNNQTNSNEITENIPLEERLKLLPDEQIDRLPPSLLQNYIAYARKNIHPILTKEAASKLEEFYVELRRVRTGIDAIPVTTRQFEGLIRLTQARARLELSNEATLEHALDVLAIVRYSLVDVFSTDDGELHVTRNINGGGMSQATQAKKFIRALREHSSAIEKTLFEVKELRQIAADIGIVSTDFTRLIDSLNLQGIILKKGPNIYKFCSE